MCLSPISIPNPNYGMAGKGLNYLKDCTSIMIRVPCGHCKECIASKQMQIIQRVQMESLKNHIFFCTLTYNNESLPVVSTSTGYDIRYADIRDLSLMFKRLRKSRAFGRPFRYFAVSELGSARGRPHFHILWLVPKYDGDDYNTCLNLENVMFHAVLQEWRRNYGSTRHPDYRPLCTYVRKLIRGRWKSNYDLHYVNPSLSSDSTGDVGFYVLKYMLKRSDRETRLQRALHMNLSPQEYEDIWSLVRSRYVKSLDFGLPHDLDVISYLRAGIKRSLLNKSDYPLFYNPATGQTFPLSKYYRNFGHIFSLEDAYKFKGLDPNLIGLDYSSDLDEVPQLRTYTELMNEFNRYEKILSSAVDSDAGDFDDLFT